MKSKRENHLWANEKEHDDNWCKGLGGLAYTTACGHTVQWGAISHNHYIQILTVSEFMSKDFLGTNCPECAKLLPLYQLAQADL